MQWLTAENDMRLVKSIYQCTLILWFHPTTTAAHTLAPNDVKIARWQGRGESKGVGGGGGGGGVHTPITKLWYVGMEVAQRAPPGEPGRVDRYSWD